MVCKDNQNNWFLKGIASYVARFCNMTHHPNVFTDVQKYIGWINNNTGEIYVIRRSMFSLLVKQPCAEVLILIMQLYIPLSL